MSLRRTLRSITRAARGGKRPGGLGKKAVKGAAKWAVKQGAKRAGQAAVASMAANPVVWAVAGAAAAGAALMAGLVLISAMMGSGGGGETADHTHPHLRPAAAPAPQQPPPVGSTGSLWVGDRTAQPGTPWCRDCAKVLTEKSERGLRALALWRAGILEGSVPGLTHCPVERVDAVATGRGWGNSRTSWDSANRRRHPRGWRFHAGTDVFKQGGSTAEKVNVIAMTDGKLRWNHQKKNRNAATWHNIILETGLTISGRPLNIFYSHVDNTKTSAGNDLRGQDPTSGVRRVSGSNVQAGDIIGTISTTTAGGMDTTAPHVHLGFNDRTELYDPVRNGRGNGTWDPWSTVKHLCRL